MLFIILPLSLKLKAISSKSPNDLNIFNYKTIGIFITLLLGLAKNLTSPQLKKKMLRVFKKPGQHCT